ncbi:MAG: hypothetical protein KF729_05080 [Sandaracinaceae bacterium]|nr:hypothetical protein [Sandaracinaceae bacterium]
MSKEASPARAALVIGALALAGLALFWRFRGNDAPPPLAPTSPADAGAPTFAEPTPLEAPTTTYDPEPLARLLLDGSTAAEAEQAAAIYAPEPPTRGVEEPEEVARERMEAAAAAAAAEPVARAPGTPAQQLRQATFWRGLLDSRLDAMREALREAEASGDAQAAERSRRLLARLEGQRPALDERIEALRREAEPE